MLNNIAHREPYHIYNIKSAPPYGAFHHENVFGADPYQCGLHVLGRVNSLL